VVRARRRSLAPSGARVRLALLASAVILVIAALLSSGGGGPPPGPPLPGIGRPARAGDPFAYTPAREAEFIARATAGSASPLFVKSPGGALATAARVASFRGQINRAVAGTGIDPNLLEGLVFVESAGRPQIIAGSDPSGAAGLTQILAQTGQSLLGMRVDLARSRALTAAIDRADALGQTSLLSRLLARRARADDRFDPARALAATVRYLRLAEAHFGRQDLAFVSYHMGIGNLTQVLGDYDGGQAVPYARLYFDTALDNHPSAYRLLAGFGDDSSLYYWRLLGAVQVMRLYRTDRSALSRLNQLQLATASTAEVLHPPDHTQSYADPNALSTAYSSRELLPLPRNARRLGLAYFGGMGSLARQVGGTAALYRGLRPAALDLLIELAARVRTLSGGITPLTVASTVSDRRYQQQLGVIDPPAQTGYTFEIARRYASRAQAAAFQAMLDRLQALNLIAWTRGPATISVTVASDASRVIADGL
jgi:transglycosylase-like protein with SLT domain